MLPIKQLLYLTFVAVTALSAEVMCAGTEEYWVVWSALTLSLVAVGNTFSARIKNMVITGVLMAVASLLATVFSLFTPVLIAYLVLLTAVCVYVARAKPDLFYPAFIINVMTLVSGITTAPLMAGISRATIILMGTAIAGGYQLLLYPSFYQTETKWLVLKVLKTMRNLADDIFACLLQPEYSDNLYLFERRIHCQKSRCMQLLLHLQAVAKQTNKQVEVVDNISRVFDAIVSVSLLRYRVTDYTVFGLCSNELRGLQEEIGKNIQEMAAVYAHKNPFMNTDGLQDKIERMEENYQTVIQVAAREPLVFLLFLSSLKALQAEMESYYDLVSHKQGVKHA